MVIFTNQGGVEKGKQDIQHILDKIIDLSLQVFLHFCPFFHIFLKLRIPLQAFVATADNVYRKPSTKMYELFIEQYNGGVSPSEIVFVGDAAGRKGDISCSDRSFAFNIKAEFKTPEEFFENQWAVTASFGRP